MPVGQAGKPEPLQLLAITNCIDRGHDLKNAAGLDQPTNTAKNFRIGQDNCPKQAAPWEIDSYPVGDPEKPIREIFRSGLDEHRIHKPALCGFSCDLYRGFFKRLPVRIYSDGERVRLLLGEVVNKTSVARTEVDNNASIQADTFDEFFPR